MLTDEQVTAAAELLKRQSHTTPQDAARMIGEQLGYDWVEAWMAVNSLIRSHDFHLYIYEDDCYLRYHGKSKAV